MIDGIDDAAAVGGVAISFLHPCPGDLPGQSHDTDGCGACLEQMIRVCGGIGAHHAGQLTAGAGDASHLGPAVADDVTALAVRDQVDGAGDGSDDVILPRELLGKAYGFIEIFLSDRIGHIGIDAPCRAAAGCQRLDL